MKSEGEIPFGRGTQWLVTALFLIVLVVPGASLLIPAFRPETSPVTSGETWVGLLRSLDVRFKAMPVFESGRRRDQSWATRFFGLGNRRVAVGRDGWLYYQPDLDAAAGKGPMHEEPDSVAREKTESSWQPPTPVIADFSKQLRARGIRLLFVPVPTKPMIAREGLGLRAPSEAPELWTSTLAELRRLEVEVVDLFPLLLEMEREGSAFLKQDTHWKPSAMEAAAQKVGEVIGVGESLEEKSSIRIREGLGDLVGMLGFDERSGKFFEPERIDVRPLAPTPPANEVVLLGDSFANIFEDADLGFGDGAGFPSHLQFALGRSIETLAVNGGGATAVREAFVRLPNARLENVRAVIWLISARDLLLAELPARRAGIEWRSVNFPEASSPSSPMNPGETTFTGTLRERSAIDDSRETPYASAIFSTIFEDDSGTQRLVYFWAFRERRLEPASGIQVGKRFRLQLVPLDGEAEVKSATRLDNLFRPELEPWFARDFSAVPE